MIDVAGQDGTEAFEDVGHSDEAREILEGLYIGDLKRQVRKYLLPHTPILHISLNSPLFPLVPFDFPIYSRHNANIYVKTQPGDPKPKTAPPPVAGSASSSDNAVGFGLGLYAVLLVGGAGAYFAYQYLQANGGALGSKTA